MRTDHIEALTVSLSADPFNPVISFDLAEEYKAHNQQASAITFYLRCVEYGGDNSVYVYTSLIRIAECLEYLNDRNWSVTGAILQAISYIPHRPEAWFYLSRHYERQAQWQECYTYAIVGQSHAGVTRDPLPANTDYLGPFTLLFEQAVAAWWIGRREESLINLRALQDMSLPPEYKNAIANNLKRVV